MIRNFNRGRILFQSFVICFVYSGIWTSCLAQSTIYVSGTYTGTATWSADTVKVTGSVSADTLFIEAGTVVEFQGRYGLSVYKLFANGEMGDTILFTLKDTTGFSDPDPQKGGWGGIFVYSKGLLKYCKVQYVKKNLLATLTGAVTNYASLEVLNCSITNNFTNGIYKEGLFNIRNSLIANNAGLGIKVEHCVLKVYDCIIRNNSQEGIFSRYGQLFIENTTIESNGNFGINSIEPSSFSTKKSIIQNNRGTGIRLNSLESPLAGIFSNNIIRFNHGYGLLVNVSNVAVINNLITGNSKAGVALKTGRAGSSTMVNNTIINNSNGIEISMNSINIYNSICRNNNKRQGEQNIQLLNEGQCNIYNSNIEEFNTDTIGGEFVNNIDTDPQFVDTANFDYRLSDTSPCINAGTMDTTGLNLPDSDLDGNPRVFDGRIDMGAFEYQQDNFHILKQPVSQVICAGAAVTLETEAIGGVLGYQWQKNGADIPSANQPTLTFNPVSLNDSGYYNCLIIADDKTVSTDTIILYVDTGINIESQSHSFSICPGKDTLIYVTASGGSMRNYSWSKNDNILPDETGSELIIPSPAIQQQDIYLCTISNACGSVVSGEITVTAYMLPVISLGEDSTISTNQRIMLGPYTNSYSYLWNNNSKSPGFEISGNDLEPGSHTIWVIVTDSNTCQNSDTMIVNVLTYSKINMTQNNSLLRIFPNPTSGIVNIEVSDFHDEDITVKLFNQQSEEIIGDKNCAENKGGTIQLNITSLPKGIYYIQIITNNGQYFGKVVLQ
jgi:hypothetical protein